MTSLYRSFALFALFLALLVPACDSDGGEGAVAGDAVVADGIGPPDGAGDDVKEAAADASEPADDALLPGEDVAGPMEDTAGLAEDVVEPADIPAALDIPATPDIPAAPDIPEETCDDEDILNGLFGPIASVSSGDVVATVEGSVHTLEIDGTAGGSMQSSSSNPYIYVDLLNDEKVAIDDFDMRDSTAWHIAFKRSTIVTNGGAQLAGDVEIVVLASDDFEGILGAPQDATWRAEDFVDEDWCEPHTNPIGGPAMALGDPTDGLWYDYDAVSHSLTVRDRVYLLRLGDAEETVVKLVIDTANDGGGLGNFVVRWAAL